jgi:hypothetical protein
MGGTIMLEQEAPCLEVGYLLFRFSLSINTTKVANATANIGAWYVLQIL